MLAKGEQLPRLGMRRKARDRDETETLTSRYRDETETLASPAETRPRRDVCSSRDVIETLKYKFYWLQQQT